MATSLKPDLSFQTIADAFAYYDLGTIKEEHLQIGGDQDINYKISATSGIYLLKLIVSDLKIPQFEFLGDLHKYLLGKGIPVPIIYKTKNDKYVENNFILYEFIDGEIKDTASGGWTIEEITSLTSNFAKMLALMQKYETPDYIKNKSDKYTRGSDIKYCHNILKPKITEIPMAKETKEMIVKTIDFLYSRLHDFEKLPKFLIHGDLNESNAIFRDNKNVGIIDFGIAYDPIVYDLGVFCYWFSIPWWTEEFNRERYNLIIETFEKIFPLSKSEKDLLPYMVLRRGMMDVILTLQWYWETPNESIPEQRLSLLAKRNSIIIKELI